MPIYINHQYVSLETIKSRDGKFYDGPEEIKRLLADTWREFDRRFFSKGLKCVFITPGIRTGIGKGNRGYSMPRVVQHKTSRGFITVAWADDLKTENGKHIYNPIGFSINEVRRTMTLDQSDIEQILFMYLFNPSMIRPGKLGGKTYLEDKEQEAIDFAMKEVANAVVAYWLYREESPLFDNEEKLATLSRVYGINPTGKSNIYIKQLITEAVRRFENRNDPEFNMKAFDKYCSRIVAGFDTIDIEAINLVAKGSLAGVVRFNTEKLVWELMSNDGKPIRMICRVPPQQGVLDKAKKVLRDHLINSSADMDILRSALNIETEEGRFDKVKISIPIPDDVDEAWLNNELTDFNDIRRIYNYIQGDTQGAKGKSRKDIMPVLIDYFVTNRQKIPFVVSKK